MQNIQTDAPVKCKKSILINEKPEKVWAVLTNINQWPEWHNEIKQAIVLEELASGTQFVWKSGGVKIRSELHTVEPYHFFGWTGKAIGMYAIHNWHISEKDGKTLVVSEESMSGWLPKLFKSAFNQNLQNGMQKWLELLKESCEGAKTKSHIRQESEVF